METLVRDTTFLSKETINWVTGFIKQLGVIPINNMTFISEMAAAYR